MFFSTFFATFFQVILVFHVISAHSIIPALFVALALLVNPALLVIPAKAGIQHINLSFTPSYYFSMKKYVEIKILCLGFFFLDSRLRGNDEESGNDEKKSKNTLDYEEKLLDCVNLHGRIKKEKCVFNKRDSPHNSTFGAERIHKIHVRGICEIKNKH